MKGQGLSFSSLRLNASSHSRSLFPSHSRSLARARCLFPSRSLRPHATLPRAVLATLRAAGFAAVRSFVEPVGDASADIGNIVFIASVEGEEVGRRVRDDKEGKTTTTRALTHAHAQHRGCALRSLGGPRRHRRARPTGISHRQQRADSTASHSTTRKAS